MSAHSTSEAGIPLDILVKANKLRYQQDYRSALRLYLQALAHGEDAQLLAAIASCYSALAYQDPDDTHDNHREAVTWMEKAVALAPNDGYLRAVLAQYYALGLLDYEQAAREYRNAIALNPNNAWILNGAASLYGVPEAVVTRDEAISWLERAIQIEPYDPNYLFRLGEFYLEAQRRQDAERVWTQALLCPRALAPGATPLIEEFIRR